MKARELSASKVPSLSFLCPARRSATALPMLAGGCLAMRSRENGRRPRFRTSLPAQGAFGSLGDYSRR